MGWLQHFFKGAEDSSDTVERRSPEEAQLAEELIRHLRDLTKQIEFLREDFAGGRASLPSDSKPRRRRDRDRERGDRDRDRDRGDGPQSGSFSNRGQRRGLPKTPPEDAPTGSLVDYLRNRKVMVFEGQDDLARNEAFEHLARHIGQHFGLVAPFYEKLKRSVATKRFTRIDIEGLSDQERSAAVQLGTLLHRHGLLKDFYYHRSPKKVLRVIPTSDGETAQFLTGGWLELYVSWLLSRKLKSRFSPSKYQILFNVKGTLPDGREFESDLMAWVDGKMLWVECKTGNWQDYSARFRGLVKIFGCDRNSSGLLLIRPPDASIRSRASDMLDMSLLTMQEISPFLNRFLGLPADEDEGAPTLGRRENLRGSGLRRRSARGETGASGEVASPAGERSDASSASGGRSARSEDDSLMARRRRRRRGARRRTGLAKPDGRSSAASSASSPSKAEASSDSRPSSARPEGRAAASRPARLTPKSTPGGLQKALQKPVEIRPLAGEAKDAAAAASAAASEADKKADKKPEGRAAESGDTRSTSRRSRSGTRNGRTAGRSDRRESDRESEAPESAKAEEAPAASPSARRRSRRDSPFARKAEPVTAESSSDSEVIEAKAEAKTPTLKEVADKPVDQEETGENGGQGAAVRRRRRRRRLVSEPEGQEQEAAAEASEPIEKEAKAAPVEESSPAAEAKAEPKAETSEPEQPQVELPPAKPEEDPKPVARKKATRRKTTRSRKAPADAKAPPVSEEAPAQPTEKVEKADQTGKAAQETDAAAEGESETQASGQMDGPAKTKKVAKTRTRRKVTKKVRSASKADAEEVSEAKAETEAPISKVSKAEATEAKEAESDQAESKKVEPKKSQSGVTIAPDLAAMMAQAPKPKDEKESAD
ncbi:MAG: hypothetical protein DWQ01_16700 [Planctomycetota bacterium]|nr:MAG: hypothetical protein DWQ01_16700 [Planctomycetota bacterium]